MDFKNLPDEFYPTPPELIAKMLETVIRERNKTILEPSAGKGDILDFISLYKQNESGCGYKWLIEQLKESNYDDIPQMLLQETVKDFKNGKRAREVINAECIEIDSNLCAILKDKGYRVYNDDFLLYDDDKHYDLIIMNPPFSNGDEHLLKAISIAEKTGSKIICLLNAETIKNPYSNKRKSLANKLEKYGAEIEYMQNAFSDAERETDVEVAIVRADVPTPFKENSRIWEELETNDIEINEPEFSGEIVSANEPLKMAVKLYKKELEAGKRLIEEYLSLKPYLTSSFENEDTPSYMRGCMLTLYSDSKKKTLDWNEYLYSVRYKYWHQLLHNPKCELCAFSGRDWLRITARAIASTDAAAAAAMEALYPVRPGDGTPQLFCLCEGTAVLAKYADVQKVIHF